MSKRIPRLLLQDMLEAIGKIERYTAGLDRADFLWDEKTVDAVVRNLEIVGEAVRQLPDEFKASHAEIPWTQIAGLRNRIVHDYFGLDLEIIWQVFVGALPYLKEQLSQLETSL